VASKKTSDHDLHNPFEKDQETIPIDKFDPFAKPPHRKDEAEFADDEDVGTGDV